MGRQPPWSDQPFVVLTNHNEGGNLPRSARVVIRLRNGAFSSARCRQSRFRPRYFPRSALEDDSIKLVRTLKPSAAPLQNWSDWGRRERPTLSGRTVNSEKKLRVAKRPGSVAAGTENRALGTACRGGSPRFQYLLMAVIGNLDLLSKN